MFVQLILLSFLFHYGLTIRNNSSGVCQKVNICRVCTRLFSMRFILLFFFLRRRKISCAIQWLPTVEIVLVIFDVFIQVRYFVCLFLIESICFQLKIEIVFGQIGSTIRTMNVVDDRQIILKTLFIFVFYAIVNDFVQ